MNIQLPKNIERDILAAVRRGHFASVDDALVKAWQSFRRQEAAAARPKAAAKPGKKPKRAKAAPPKPEKPPTPDELNQYMLSIGLITQLPDPSQDLDDDDPEDEPIVIEGEPLSETIIRERR
jgi:Arc/MetJ-type ribon-helix-helix transcriptional regulator